MTNFIEKVEQKCTICQDLRSYVSINMVRYVFKFNMVRYVLVAPKKRKNINRSLYDENGHRTRPLVGKSSISVLKNWNKFDKFHRKSGTKVYNLPGFEILCKSINMVRYVFKFSYMRCSGLCWKMCGGFVGFQLDL